MSQRDRDEAIDVLKRLGIQPAIKSMPKSAYVPSQRTRDTQAALDMVLQEIAATEARLAKLEARPGAGVMVIVR